MVDKLIYSLPLLLGDIFSDALDGIVNSILYGIRYVIGLVAYGISAAVLKLVSLFYSFFRVFAGLTKVSYDGESKYLINVFFDNAAINKVYWYMAALGFVFMFVFALVAVIRKLFDPFEKQKASYGQILMGCGKSILIILLMTGIMNVALSATNLLMQRINYMFNRATATTPVGKRTFTGEEIAKMNRIMEIIGNYAINPSYNSRYNINSCFNAIREPMLELQNAGVFEYDYDNIDCWQKVLKNIAKSTSLKKDLMVDVYHDGVTRAIEEAMSALKNNANFRPVQSITSGGLGATADVPIDAIIFLAGTAGAAKSSYYNETVSVNDALRGPYYNGKRSIYSLDHVDADFEIAVGAGGIDYIIIIIMGVLIIWQLITCVLTCAVRIFNMLLLYVIAPPMAATIPLDDGQRFKSWTDAMVVQCLNVFGTVIIMRLAMLYIPIIMSDKLVLFDNSFMNLIGKAVLIYAGFVAAGRGADLFSGVIMGNGAGASAQAGNMQAQGLAAANILGAVASDVSGLTKVKDKMQKSYKKMVSQGGIVASTASDIKKKLKPKKNNQQNSLPGDVGGEGSGIGAAMAADDQGESNAESANVEKQEGSKNTGANKNSSKNNDTSKGGGTSKKTPPTNPANKVTAPSNGGGGKSGGNKSGGKGSGGNGNAMNQQLQGLQQSLQSIQLNQQQQKANDEEKNNQEEYEEYDEVASTALGNALGIHNTLSSAAQKDKHKSKEKPKKQQSHNESQKLSQMQQQFSKQQQQMQQQVQQQVQQIQNNLSNDDDKKK